MSAEVRLRAIDPSASYLVQAPAGSGKTELLTRRILKLLAIVDEPEEILALTFTRKAAAEMRGRVIEALTMGKPDDPASHRMETWQLACEANARSEQRGWHLSEHPSRLRMMTLDSFTHALARQMPLLSGLGDMPTPSTHVAPLYREASEAAVAKLVRRNPGQAAVVLLHQDHNMVSLIGLLAEMLGRRDQWLHDVEMYAQDTAGLRAMLEQNLSDIIAQQLNGCSEKIPIGVRGEMPALLRFAGENLADDELMALHSWPGSGIEHLARWQKIAGFILTKDRPDIRKQVNKNTGFPTGKEFADNKQKFVSLLECLSGIDGLNLLLDGIRKLPAEPRFDESQWQVLEGLFSLLQLANEQLQQLFEQRGEADFIEISLRAMRALEDEKGRPTDLLLRLDYRIHHILVDEFQDTSLLQMRLLQNLTEGWQAGDGTDRSLFMVGDPMQSIYRFRKAEVGLFLLAAANRAGLPQVEALNLTRNFRSSPVIVDWVNRAFASIFPAEPDILLAAVGHAEAHAALDHDGKVQLHLQRQKDVISEASAVVTTIRRELDKDAKRIAVLARSRKHLHAILIALEDARIPFRAVDILPLNRRPEVHILRALLRALLHSADRESWAALLRGLCCGLSTSELHQLLIGDLRPVEVIIADETVLARLDEDTRSRICHLRSALAPCLAVAGRIPLRSLLTTAWKRLAMPGLIDANAAPNVEAMFDLIEELDEGGVISFSHLDERLEKLYASPDNSAEASRVELLTMHGAKGLQWDVVILPGLGHGNSRSDSPLLAFTDVPVQGGAHPLVAVRGAVRSSDAIYDLVRGVEKTRENNEFARLLYVACTRAESALYMFGHLNGDREEGASGSLLKLLLPDGAAGDCFGATVAMMDEQMADEMHQRRPLHRISTVPEPANDITEANVAAEREYFWSGAEAAPVGNAVHAALQRIGEQGAERWGEAESTQELARIRRLLVGEGLSGEMLDQAETRAATALQRTLASETGCWILSGESHDAHCEWSLSSNEDGHVVHHVIDRSFIDADGVRWIIDYKTASHEGGDLEGFLAEEAKRHAPQLSRYASILRMLEPARKIRTALYFPMLDVMREVDLAQ
ncbi:ATP-dependent exoDNAse (exonuclease V) beta subunit (contains helicase and exonuclease domains) [Mariprofundus ferrinatatus]|uniref:DNA 3'-5' helicase n=1 Tax=Mariprofundus ferrinatatus TaxID=1921087 RepID=A0A2K8L406_9PROT|nr:UvrD-helicase domain-containing protein [Mariprofundus ferrinatatus]ATX81842.1 ATP-dependent exoDNAse (exonuclease V) beta subunit (contains helicase and exonuclease domains) [Mariprofundus ferrinatatus]